MKNKAITILIYILVFSFIHLIITLIFGYDPAAGIAQYIPLIPDGTILTGVFGGLFSAWLLWRGKQAVAGFGGWQLGMIAGYLVWLFGRSYVWVIEVILKSAFGENAVFFTSIIVMGILFGVMRLVSQFGVELLTWLIEKGELWEKDRIIRAELANVNIEAESGA